MAGASADHAGWAAAVLALGDHDSAGDTAVWNSHTTTPNQVYSLFARIY
jgi:hypothetical protein